MYTRVLVLFMCIWSSRVCNIVPARSLYIHTSRNDSEWISLAVGKISKSVVIIIIITCENGGQSNKSSYDPPAKSGHSFDWFIDPHVGYLSLAFFFGVPSIQFVLFRFCFVFTYVAWLFWYIQYANAYVSLVDFQ